MSWNASIHLTATTAEIVVTDRELSEILKARLPRPRHFRALLLLLEALALWHGKTLRGAVSASGMAPVSCDEDPFGFDLWPDPNPLVDVVFALPRGCRDSIELGESLP